MVANVSASVDGLYALAVKCLEMYFDHDVGDFDDDGGKTVASASRSHRPRYCHRSAPDYLHGGGLVSLVCACSVGYSVRCDRRPSLRPHSEDYPPFYAFSPSRISLSDAHLRSDHSSLLLFYDLYCLPSVA